ncbi:MAG: glycosyltransferase [Nitrospirae bacterium]|nr:glycosyltransferase [Nitrospirota bacterium]
MFFRKNITALKKVDPGLAGSIEKGRALDEHDIVKAKNGMKSLKVDNILLHSLYDPAKEAREWFNHHEEKTKAASSIFVLGFGLGYHLLELCKKTEKEIIVFEPRLDIIRAAMESVCLTTVLERVRILTDENPSLSPLGKVGIKGGENAVVLQHKPSVNISREYFKHLLARLRSREEINKGIQILVVSPVYGGSHPIALYCASTLKKMGHNVELIDNSRFSDAMFFAKDIAKDKRRHNRMIDMLTSFLSEAVIARCETFKPDLVFALAQSPLTADCLKRLKNNNIPTAYWFVEDFRLMDYWKNIAGLYDYFFVIQKGDLINEMKRAGVKNYHYLPLAASPDVHKKVEMPDDERDYYGSDISFVGAGYYNRRNLFKGLLDHDFKIWGTDWDMNSPLAQCVQRAGERVDTDEIVKIFNASKININLHSSTYHNGINPFGDFVNPRTFEIAACGAFQLVDSRSELADLFEAGKEIIVFEGLEDLKQKITYYLDNPAERESIAESAKQRVLRDHTYEHRMVEMLEYLADNGFTPALWEQEGEIVERLIEEAGRDTELGEYLSRFPSRERMTLSDIVKDIEESEGDLNIPETLFLTMNEFLK